MNAAHTRIFVVVLVGVLLHLIVPMIFAVLVATFFMAWTLGEVYRAIAEATAFFLGLQFVGAFISSACFAVCAFRLLERLSSLWVYPLVIATSLAIHLWFLGMTVLSWYLTYSKNIYFGILRYNVIIAVVVAPILGFVAIISNAVAGRNNKRLDQRSLEHEE